MIVSELFFFKRSIVSAVQGIPSFHLLTFQNLVLEPKSSNQVVPTEYLLAKVPTWFYAPTTFRCKMPVSCLEFLRMVSLLLEGGQKRFILMNFVQLILFRRRLFPVTFSNKRIKRVPRNTWPIFKAAFSFHFWFLLKPI